MVRPSRSNALPPDTSMTLVTTSPGERMILRPSVSSGFPSQVIFAP